MTVACLRVYLHRKGGSSARVVDESLGQAGIAARRQANRCHYSSLS
jgi:hypothetical protein